MDARTALEKLRDYETVIDTMHCGLLAEDLDGKIVFMNERLLAWLSYSKQEVEGQHVEMLVPPELRELLYEDMKAASEGDLRARIMAVRRKDSTTFPVVTIPQRFSDVHGNHDGHFSIIVDLGAVITAKPVGSTQVLDVRNSLDRIATELHAISVCVCGASGTAPAIPLEHPELRDLSPREQEVLALLVAGTRVPAISERLYISQYTVRNHLKSMFRKLGVGSQSELIERVRGLSSAGDGGSPADA